MNDVDLAFIMIIFVAMFLIFIVQAVFYVVQSLAWMKINKALEPDSTNVWQVWVPVWRYYYISTILGTMPNSNEYMASLMVYWLVFNVLSFIFSPLVTVVSLGLFVFNLYKAYTLTGFVDGNYSILHLLITFFGFGCVTDYIYARKIETNATEYQTKAVGNTLKFEDRIMFKTSAKTTINTDTRKDIVNSTQADVQESAESTSGISLSKRENTSSETENETNETINTSGKITSDSVNEEVVKALEKKPADKSKLKLKQ